MIRVFIGYERAEEIAFHVLAHSLMKQCSEPISITPVNSRQLKFHREWDIKQSNDFAFTRWLVPYMCGYTGKAIFMDCDMLARDDIAKLWNETELTKPVHVVKHDYTPKTKTKFLGNPQTTYERKNWSSVMVFNCSHSECKKLTPEYVEKASGLDLHQFKWVADDRIGEISKEWNHLVGEYDPNPNAKLAHFTIGGPWFHEHMGCEFSEEWWDMHDDMKYCEQLVIPRVGRMQ